MLVVYRPSDKITIRVGDVVIKVSPLTYEQKTKVLSQVKMEGGKAVQDGARSSFLTMKYSIREVVSGLPEMRYPDGELVTLQWEDGQLTDESLELLLQVFGYSRGSVLSTRLALGKYENADGIVFGEPKAEDPAEKKT